MLSVVCLDIICETVLLLSLFAGIVVRRDINQECVWKGDLGVGQMSELRVGEARFLGRKRRDFH